MPDVKEGESQQDYVSRCIPIVLKEGTAKDEKQAAAICYSMWREKHNQQQNFAKGFNPSLKPIFIIKCCKQLEGLGFSPEDQRYVCNGTWEAIEEEYLPGQPPDEGQDGYPIDPKKQIGDAGPAKGQYQTDKPTTVSDTDNKLSFMKRCRPHLEGRGYSPDEAAYTCNGIWEAVADRPPGEDIDIKEGGGVGGTVSRRAELPSPERFLFCLSCENIQPINNTMNLDSKTGEIQDDFKAICVYGDKFYKGKFLPMKELQKAYKSLNGSYHDINHWGTTYLDGNPNIEYIVGYQDNVRLDNITKALTADIHVLRSAEKYQLWRGFVDINQRINRVPNVSVSFYSSKKKMKAKELEGIDFAADGYKGDDEVEYLYDLDFQALSTVFKGACSDKDGCGIGIKQDAKKEDIKNLEAKIKRFKGEKV